jgi:hypothetical protein
LTPIQSYPHESHEPGHKSVPSPLKDVQECSDEGSAQAKCEGPAFEEVRDEEGGRGLVEAVLFLQDKRGVDRQRQRRNRREEKESEDKYDGLEDLREG